LAEFGFRIEEVEEIFLYISNGEGIFRYRDWLIYHNINLKIIIEGLIRRGSSISNIHPDPDVPDSPGDDSHHTISTSIH